jgi:hypothetical protein
MERNGSCSAIAVQELKIICIWRSSGVTATGLSFQPRINVNLPSPGIERYPRF